MNTPTGPSILLLLLFVIFKPTPKSQAQVNSTSIDLVQQVETCLEKAIDFYRSIAIEGGYVYHYTLDLKEKWGEGKTDDFTIEVQAPGTPAVGTSFLRAYKATGKQPYLEAAKAAASALMKGQNQLGGWQHKIYFNRLTGNVVSFDDNQTQGAISFLMALDQEIDDDLLDKSIQKALDLMVESQLENGGWPHQYPEQLNYHDFATFNDQGINDCIRVMLEASTFYDEPKYERCLQKAGRFIILAQLPPPQPGWAQQYNAYLQPAWARSFEPPSVCTQVTLHNINSLLDLYDYSKQRIYLEPIHDALRWLKESQLSNGKWGRFLEIGTNKPLYYDRDRIRVNSLEELSLERRTGYGYEIDISKNLALTEKRFNQAISPAAKLETSPNEPNSADFEKLETEIKEILESLDQSGRWIAKNDKFRDEAPPGERWNGQYRTEDRISSALFNRNVATLCHFLELKKN